MQAAGKRNKKRRKKKVRGKIRRPKGIQKN
jgi:hypothetical protein